VLQAEHEATKVAKENAAAIACVCAALDRATNYCVTACRPTPKHAGADDDADSHASNAHTVRDTLMVHEAAAIDPSSISMLRLSPSRPFVLSSTCPKLELQQLHPLEGVLSCQGWQVFRCKGTFSLATTPQTPQTRNAWTALSSHGYLEQSPPTSSTP